MTDYRMIHRSVGGPEVIEHEAVQFGPVAAGQVRVRHQAVGLNFIDAYRRTGLYPVDLPSSLGSEAAGVVEAVGDGVTDFAVGQPVAYFSGPVGAYSTARDIAPEHLIALPDDIDVRTAAASLLKGMTAGSLIEDCAKMTAGQTALVHAAAGGVGSILVQWLKAVGVRVIAHAGSEAKAKAARENGADLALFTPLEGLSDAVRAATEGRGVDVVFDGVGAATWRASVDSVARRGLMVAYGNASGPVPPVSPLELSRAGSIFLTRPTLFDYASTPDERRELAGRLFARIRAGEVKIEIGQTFPLAEAAEAHRRMESRSTTGSTLLTVD